MKFTEKLQKANEVLDWLEDFLKADVFTSYTNLKLYDIASNLYAENYVKPEILERMDDNVWNREFTDFCEQSFMGLEDWCNNEYGKDWHHCVEYIGRTSSFYVRVNCSLEIEDNFNDVLDGILEYFVTSSFNTSGLLSPQNRFDMETIRNYFKAYGNEYDMPQELVDVVDYIISDLKEDVTKQTHDMISLWGYIKDFKDNQCQLFAEHLAFEYEAYPEFFLSICPFCGEKSEHVDIDEDTERCWNCGHYYDGRDKEFKLSTLDVEENNGKLDIVDAEIAIVGIEYDRLFQETFPETVYRIRYLNDGKEQFAMASEIKIEVR